MKYMIILGDGMADEPIDQLGGKTPLEVAQTPNLDAIAKQAELGLVKTVPDGMAPGSDTANLSVIGYDPKVYYTGRSPLEALSIGVDLEDTDIAIRCNLVTLSESEDYENKTIIDHSSSEISTEDAEVLLNAVKEQLETDTYKFYKGTSYRHLTIWKKGEVIDLVPPHDQLGNVVKAYLPTNEDLKQMMMASYDILSNHPINLKRQEQGLNKANSIWFWGAGTKPMLKDFEEKTSKKGAMISAVDLLKGIAVGTNMKNISVDGANGGLHTNYEGKARAAVKTLLEEGNDFVYVHVEAPDEMGHQGSLEHKIQAIEYLDEKVIGLIKQEMDQSGEPYRMLILPDHPTPLSIRTHTSNPVPYLLYDSSQLLEKGWLYNEKEANESEHYVEEGHKLIEKLFLR